VVVAWLFVMVVALVACSRQEARTTSYAAPTPGEPAAPVAPATPGGATPAAAAAGSGAATGDGASGTALVELFTSEGCSSCPPADEVLSTLGGDRVFALSFHVDYWDGAGWRDPFSQHAFTERQEAYAQALGTQVFTPEMVVGGAAAFNGSDATRARAAIGTALAAQDEAKLHVTAHDEGTAVRVEWTIGGAVPRGALLDIALVDASETVRVGGGENGGKTLRHTNVVRALDESPLARGASGGGTSGARTLRAASGASAVVAWVQDESSLRVLGAARADVR
jgi:hypothetical protein